MTIAELFNLVIDRFGTRGRFETVGISQQGCTTGVLVLAGNKYQIVCGWVGSSVSVVRLTSDGMRSVDNFSRWVEGVLNGQKRNEAGELVDA